MKTKIKHLLLPLLLFLSTVGFGAGDGQWTKVRRSDWDFWMKRVVFLDARHGFVKGNHDELLVTENGGERWNLYPLPDSVTDALDGFWYDMQLSRENDIWLAGSSGAILYIPSDTKNWTFSCLPNRDRLMAISFVDQLTGWVASEWGQIYHTGDGAQAWKQVYDFDAIIWDLCFTDSLRGFVLVRTGEDLSRGYRTDDGGHTWSLISNPDVHGRSLYFLDQSHGWILGEYHEIFRTTDGGASWQTVTADTGAERFASIYFLTPSLGWIVGADGLVLQTRDGGLTWQRQPSPTSNNLTDIFFIDDQHGWVTAEWGIIAATADGGATWQWQVECPNSLLLAVHFLDEREGFAIGWKTFIHTRDAGLTWDYTDSLSGHDIQFVDSRHGWLAAVNHVYATTDGGASWHKQFTFTEQVINDIEFIDAQHGWALSTSATEAIVHRTQDGGLHWERLPSLPYGLYAMDFVSPSRGWLAGGRGVIVTTDDGGLTWTLQREGQPILYDTLNDLQFVDAEYGWAVGFNGRILHTEDGGQTWIEQHYTGALDDQYNALYFLDRNEGWVVGLVGIRLHTTDGGQTWDESHSEYMGLWWKDVFFTDPDHGWVVGIYNGVDKYLGKGLAVSQPDAGVPEQFLLYPSRPNPMHTVTRIGYFVPYPARVQVIIYNLMGQRVRTLVDREQSDGEQAVVWDGRDDAGRRVANGTYLYHLRAGNLTRTRKLVVAR